jgi:hypothetical protein
LCILVTAAIAAAAKQVVDQMEWHKVRLQQLDIAKELIALQRETMVKQANLTTMAQPHVTRDTTVSMLDSAVAQEANEWNNTQAALVDEAIAAVTKQVRTYSVFSSSIISSTIGSSSVCYGSSDRRESVA